jgi:hypothetical protein
MKVSKAQRETDIARAGWHIACFLPLKIRFVLVPFAIINQIYRIPHTELSFSYRDVFVFGVRVARIQVN